MTNKPTLHERVPSTRNQGLADPARREEYSAAACLRGKKTGTKISTLLSLVVLALLPGCTLCKNAKRTIIDEPSDFSWMEDRKESIEVYHCWADRAWREQSSADPEQCTSSIYIAGFKDGFVEYVFAGGTGEPPPVPPRQYWNVDQRNPRGHMAATDWFAGFRHGAQVAREEGYRKRAVVPASMFLKCNSQKTCAAGQQSNEGPSWNSTTAPRLPELMPLGQPEPAATPENSPRELPVLENPAAQLPGVEVQQDEPMPLPQSDLLQTELPQTELPLENVPEATEVPPLTEPSPSEPEAPTFEPEAPPASEPEQPRSPPTVEDIFGSAAFERESNEQQGLRQSNYEVTDREVMTNREVVKRQQALSAFSSALQGRSQAKSEPMLSQSEQTLPRTTELRQVPGRVAPRTETIPRSHGRPVEMFRRFSR